MTTRAVVWGALAGVLAWGADPPRFVPSEDCALCHARIPAPGQSWNSGPWIGQYPLWSGSMMAHSSADPYWRAKVRFEVEQAPAQRKAIEDTCLRCHAPMQQYPTRATGRGLSVSDLAELGNDGVGCALCHQIQPQGLGVESSFTANFEIGTGNLMFGPHREPFTMPMLHHTGFEPREARHILDSALCGTCHTVITQPLKSGAGAPARFVEQAPFLEWLASGYPQAGKSCQGCHMPPLESAQYIAHRPPGGAFPPTDPRTPFGRHEFIGGNAVIPRLLARLDPAQAAVLETTTQRAESQLERSLKLQVSTRRQPGALLVDVAINNLAGHKLPTGFPSRRLWLRVALLDERQSTIWESGDWQPESGRLRIGEGLQPHHLLIEKPEQVQIFEVEAVDARGRLTHSLLGSARQKKDSRILPMGFDRSRLTEKGLGALNIDPVGVKPGDDFRSGFALTHYNLPLVQAGKGCRLVVEALYQTVKPEHRPADFALSPDLARPVVIARVEQML
ncbi:multiheme c-type cytochrome [uncultured Paludibaculum sp.]|uniref:multiheme c-type cytochrome n=1 Tax=uncultured Paludibaculum sp. TaxID=1765020 RepID=UPI002AABDA2A|nr:multiheme c-type cytochrome [uncultured Paludibaculum sp.]